MSVADAKAGVRAVARARVDAMGEAARAAASARIVAHLVDSAEWSGAATVLAYLSMPREVDLDGLWALGGRTLCAPRTAWAARSMVAAALGEVSSAVEVRPGLREPGPGAPTVDRLDLVLVPGVAFDPAGRRLGRGGGFYDRFLAGVPARTAVMGVCFGCQVVDEVPSEAHDVRVGGLVTESGVHRFGAEG